MKRRMPAFSLFTFCLVFLASTFYSFTPGYTLSVQAQEDAPVSELPPGGFIEATGSQLTRLGQPVDLKGVYYEFNDHRVDEMWRHWDAPRIAHDLRLIREETGSNVVLIRLPYELRDISPAGQVSDELALRFRELLQIVGNLDMRLIVTLFDGYEAFPMPGRNSERLNLAYLKTLIGAFGDDPRILAWDIYAEPDDHWMWDNDPERVQSWLVRMANAVQQLTPDQLVLVSMESYPNVWRPDFDGHVLLNFVDVVMLRGSDAEDVADGVEDIRTHTDKPVLLFDFHHASGPPCYANRYTEEQQVRAFRDVLIAMNTDQIAGVIARDYRDEDSGPYDAWDHRRYYEGLFREDGTPKPATATMREYAVAPLPVVHSDELPLRVVSYKQPERIDTDIHANAPLQVEGSAFYVRNELRHAWELFGGRYSFGMPLMDAYKRAEDNRVVQYFDGAVLELHPDARSEDDYAELGRFERLQAVVRVMDVGTQYAEIMGLEFPPPPEEVPYARYFSETGHYLREGPFRTFYNRASGEWRLGAPISEEMTEEINGVPTTVQYFERGRLELDPATEDVRMGQLGSWRFAYQCEHMP